MGQSLVLLFTLAHTRAWCTRHSVATTVQVRALGASTAVPSIHSGGQSSPRHRCALLPTLVHLPRPQSRSSTEGVPLSNVRLHGLPQRLHATLSPPPSPPVSVTSANTVLVRHSFDIRALRVHNGRVSILRRRWLHSGVIGVRGVTQS